MGYNWPRVRILPPVSKVTSSVRKDPPRIRNHLLCPGNAYESFRSGTPFRQLCGGLYMVGRKHRFFRQPDRHRSCQCWDRFLNAGGRAPAGDLHLWGVPTSCAWSVVMQSCQS